MQVRVERSVVGQVAVSALIVLVLAVTVVWSMPNSALRRAVLPVTEPVTGVTGLDQSWGMFSPNPPRRVDELRVEVRISADQATVWWVPSLGVADQFWEYRWQKLKENLIRRENLRPAFCRWVADRVAGDSALGVRMVLRSETLVGPGSDAAPEVSESVLYDDWPP